MGFDGANGGRDGLHFCLNEGAQREKERLENVEAESLTDFRVSTQASLLAWVQVVDQVNYLATMGLHFSVSKGLVTGNILGRYWK